MLEILTRITEGKGTKQDLEDLKVLADATKNNSLCALGQTAANPVSSTMNSFPEEYEEHVTEKKCRAHVCKSMLQYYVIPELCKKCSLCARNCPANAITGVPGKETYVIDTDKCIKCGVCISACRFNAIIKK